MTEPNDKWVSYGELQIQLDQSQAELKEIKIKAKEALDEWEKATNHYKSWGYTLFLMWAGTLVTLCLLAEWKNALANKVEHLETQLKVAVTPDCPCSSKQKEAK